MKDEYIVQMKPWFGAAERSALENYLDENGYFTEYRYTSEFENLLAGFTGSKYCIVVNNGTISLTLAALSLGLGYGDEVIVPNYTMIATPNSMKLIGIRPVFVDVDPYTLCLDIDLFERAITHKTRAVVLVSANGRYPSFEFERLKGICDAHGIFIIEDAAQALGSFYQDGEHIGTKGVIGSFSFSTPKIISTGQGGAIVTSDSEIAGKLRKLKDFGRSQGGNDIHDTIGYNFKFTELQAVVGVAQMSQLRERIIRKKGIYRSYLSRLEGIPEVRMFEHNLDFTCPWFVDCLVRDREGLIQYLHDNGIGTRKMYGPINAQEAYGLKGSYPVSEKVGSEGLWLPSYTQLEEFEIDKVCGKIRAFYSSRSNKE